MKRLTLFCLLLLLTVSSVAYAQDVAFSGRLGFRNTPTTLGLFQETGRYNNQFIELYVGHSNPFGSDSGKSIVDRGAFVFGLNYQTRWALTNCRLPNTFGLFANLGGRLRYHTGMAAERDGEMTMSTEEGFTLTPDVMLGGGAYFRMGHSIELFGEVNGALRSLTGHEMGIGAETALGLRFFF